VLSMGLSSSAHSTRIVDRETGETFRGEGVPAYSVVVPGSLPGKPMKNGAGRPEPCIARSSSKRVDERTRAKTSINELLRD